MKKLLYTFLLSLFCVYFSVAQNGNGYINPMAHEVILSGGFAELRSSHFHSGLDYKTEQVINKPVMSIADGYVSRVGVSGSGYGNALYVTHPSTGETSLYAHLESFNPLIDSITKAYQYKNQVFACNIYLNPEDAPVKQGEIIAYSGNTGGSGGPHLHFEIRNTETGNYIDPLIYKMGVSDNVKPRMSTLKIYPQKSAGSLNNSASAKKFAVTTNNGVARFTNPTTIKAWGKIGLGIRAYDYADKADNTLGVKDIQLKVDDIEIFRYVNETFHPDESRYVLSFIDFEEQRRNKNYIMRCFVDEGNLMNVFPVLIDQGIITIDEERDYNINFKLTDAYGNFSTFAFVITGEKMDFEQPARCGIKMPFGEANIFETSNISVSIPKNSLYADICFDYETSPSDTFYSNYHQIHSEFVPLHNRIDVGIKTTKSFADSTKLYAALVNVQDINQSVYVGKYEDNTFTFKTRDFGRYVIKVDTIPPKITPVNISNFATNPNLIFRITDELTGIDSFNGYIGDKWVLF